MFKLFMGGLIAATTLLTGCAMQPVSQAQLAPLRAQTFLAAVNQDEAHALANLSDQLRKQIVAKNPSHQVPRLIQTSYREVNPVFDHLIFLETLVPATMPSPEKNSIVEIRLPTTATADGLKVGDLQATAPTLVAIVCHGADVECGKRVGAAIDAGKLPKFGKRLTETQQRLAVVIGHGIQEASAK